MSEHLEFGHTSIGELQGGGIGYAIDQAIAEAITDCQRRPGLTKARKVTIQIDLTPQSSSLDTTGPGLKAVGIKAGVKTSMPPRAGEEEFLAVGTGVDINGEAEPKARFTQAPLLRAGSN